MSFWSCKVCAAKDSMIASQAAEISFLRDLARKPEQSNRTLPVITLEADALISGTDHTMEVEAETEEERAIIEERDRLLSGNY